MEIKCTKRERNLLQQWKICAQAEAMLLNITHGDCWESQHHFPVTEKVSAQKRRKGIGDLTITINQQGNWHVQNMTPNRENLEI